MNFAGFVRVPFKRVSTLTLLLPVLLAALPAQAPAAECSGFGKQYLLQSEPVLVNPGAHCQIAILFGVEREGFVNYALPTIPTNFCVYVRRAGRADSIGPICNQNKGVIGLPGDLEYIWSAGKRIWATVTLKPKG
jgi:hypothetical protein